MAKHPFLGCLAFILSLGLSAGPSSAALRQGERPNVLFIPIDDLNDWVTHLGGHPQTVTPHLDRLAERGVTFANAHCAAPACNPSRTALLTGLRPSSTGVYHNSHPWRRVLKDVVTLPRHFKNQGYYVAGFGKVYHGSYPDPTDWDVWGRPGSKDDPEHQLIGDGGVGGIRFGPLANDAADLPDYRNVTAAIEQINRPHDKPWFIACGLSKPHMPFCVPQEYFDRFPLESIVLPEVPADDLDDIPEAGLSMARRQGDHAAIVRSGRWKEAVQAYLATINFADEQVGRLLDALDASPHRDNTIICLWSDHGWHLGEKEHWRKFALWERATKAPMIWSVPGMTSPGGVCTRPVDYMSVYPTLIDLCGLPASGEQEGVSLRALLTDPGAAWDRPALTTHGLNNHAIRTQDYRYIRYADGSEELYDHRSDPMEWKNLAGDPSFAPIKRELAAGLPSKNVPEAPHARER
ncbi:MAG: sulfatase [Planctomycetaceae bacterium]|nr:sulfatase [Planctomycetaceae bacterium]